MKSQRFGMPGLPFRKADRQVQRSQDVGERQQTREEQLALVIHEEEDDSNGEESELHVYNRRTDTRGEYVYLRAGTKSHFEPPKRRSHRACLVLTRHYNSLGELSYTELEIQSRYIRAALRKVIGKYPDVDFSPKFITIEEPPRCLFHFQDELRQHAEASNNIHLKSHMKLCLQYMDKVMHQEMKIWKSVETSMTGSPILIEFRHLWMLFKPGCLVYEKEKGIERLVRLRSICAEKDENDKIDFWTLSTEELCQSGIKIGISRYHILIEHYEGSRPIQELMPVPLNYHPEKEQIQQSLLTRGHKFLSVCGVHHCYYNGVANLCSMLTPQHNHISHTQVC